jgi:UbiD family decarboxylase
MDPGRGESDRAGGGPVLGRPVKEEIHAPEEVKREGSGIDEFPVPISTPGYDPAPFVTSGHWVTKDAETGRNVGNYRGHLKAPDRLGVLRHNPGWCASG